MYFMCDLHSSYLLHDSTAATLRLTLGHFCKEWSIELARVWHIQHSLNRVWNLSILKTHSVTQITLSLVFTITHSTSINHCSSCTFKKYVRIFLFSAQTHTHTCIQWWVYIHATMHTGRPTYHMHKISPRANFHKLHFFALLPEKREERKQFNSCSQTNGKLLSSVPTWKHVLILCMTLIFPGLNFHGFVDWQPCANVWYHKNLDQSTNWMM